MKQNEQKKHTIPTEDDFDLFLDVSVTVCCLCGELVVPRDLFYIDEKHWAGPCCVSAC